MVWSLSLSPDDGKQGPVVYGAKFGAVFLTEGSRTAFMREDLDWLGLTMRVLRVSATFS